MTRATQQQIRICTSADGARIAFATSGTGPPIVKAANWLSHLEYDWTSPVWLPWFTELTRGYTLLRYDQRGCGLSDWNVQDFSIDAWVADLEAVVAAAGVKRFTLFGMSQGCAIAAAYAARHPERVSALVLLGGYAQGRLRRAANEQERDEARTLIKIIEMGWGSETPAFRQVFTTLFMPDASPAQVRAFDELQRISTSAENASRLVRGFDDIDVCALLPRVSCPALVAHSRRDMRVPFEQGRLLAALIPGARLLPLESRNHVLLDTEPAWRVFMDEAHAFIADAAEAGGAPPLAALTARENELLELIARGLDNPQIATQLQVTEKTVRNYVTSILSKLDVHSRGRAIVVAREAGFGRGRP